MPGERGSVHDPCMTTRTTALLTGTALGAGLFLLPATPAPTAHAQEAQCLVWGEDREEVIDPEYGAVWVITAYCKLWDEGGIGDSSSGEPKDGEAELPKGAAPNPKDFASREEYCEAVLTQLEDLKTQLEQVSQGMRWAEEDIAAAQNALPSAQRRQQAARDALRGAIEVTDQRQLEYASANDVDEYSEVIMRNGNEVLVQRRISVGEVDADLPGGSVLLAAMAVEARAESLVRSTTAEVNRLNSNLADAQQRHEILRQRHADMSRQIEELQAEYAASCK